MKAKRKRVVTTLTASEQRAFALVKRFVQSYCGRVSDAEVLRFLVRDWRAP